MSLTEANLKNLRTFFSNFSVQNKIESAHACQLVFNIDYQNNQFSTDFLTSQDDQDSLNIVVSIGFESTASVTSRKINDYKAAKVIYTCTRPSLCNQLLIQYVLNTDPLRLLIGAKLGFANIHGFIVEEKEKFPIWCSLGNKTLAICPENLCFAHASYYNYRNTTYNVQQCGQNVSAHSFELSHPLQIKYETKISPSPEVQSVSHFSYRCRIGQCNNENSIDSIVNKLRSNAIQDKLEPVVWPTEELLFQTTRPPRTSRITTAITEVQTTRSISTKTSSILTTFPRSTSTMFIPEVLSNSSVIFESSTTNLFNLPSTSTKSSQWTTILNTTSVTSIISLEKTVTSSFNPTSYKSPAPENAASQKHVRISFQALALLLLSYPVTEALLKD